jgi:hypothetical protein
MNQLDKAFRNKNVEEIKHLLDNGAVDDPVYDHLFDVLELNDLDIARKIITPETAEKYFSAACRRDLVDIARIAMSIAVIKHEYYIESACMFEQHEILEELIKKDFPVSEFAKICAEKCGIKRFN